MMGEKMKKVMNKFVCVQIMYQLERNWRLHHNEILTVCRDRGVCRDQVLAVNITFVMAIIARIQNSVFQVAWNQIVVAAVFSSILAFWALW